ncbi:MAG TPA: putative porin [Roseimicrobium sp.]|nr:putative porin [Roseimicrobium sp.]
MMKVTNKLPALALGTVASLAICGSVHAQSSDTLIDKLVEKGILNTREAQQLRDEADKDFSKALSAKNGMPDYVTALKLNGDFRARYEGFFRDNSLFKDQNRFRYRLRFGVTANLADNMEVGFGLISQAANGDPISGNQTMSDNGSKKPVAIDLAYAKWSPINSPDWSLAVTVGKMKNPLTFNDTLLFDNDYTPEGGAVEVGYNINDSHSLKFVGAGFILDEIGNAALGSQDPYMLAAQLRWDANWNSKIKSSLGIAVLDILSGDRLTTAGPVINIPNSINGGNTKGANGAPIAGFNPIVVDAAVTYTLDKEVPGYTGPFPITTFIDYVMNPRAKTLDEAYAVGITFGKAGKKKTWEIGYRYKESQNDSWWEETVESDSGAYYQTANAAIGAGANSYMSGTGFRGHVFKASYSPYDSLTFTMQLFNTWAIQDRNFGSTINRLQLDAQWKF